MGLNIIYNLVVGVLGGDIRVESEAENDTAFIIVLPQMAASENSL